jgi:2-iminobutanoate/2-iminopropanoate deaminase
MTMDKDIRNFGILAERSYGYAQAVKSGRTIYVSGQTASGDDGGTGAGGPGDMATQMQAAYAKVKRVLQGYGATIDQVVDETLFVTDMAAALAVAGTVRHDVYGEDIAVASTLCGVAALGGPGLMIEIKCVARLPRHSARKARLQAP